jgi:hypothetical protein
VIDRTLRAFQRDGLLSTLCRMHTRGRDIAGSDGAHGAGPAGVAGATGVARAHATTAVRGVIAAGVALALVTSGLVLGSAQSAEAKPNPYTPERVCGTGYKPVDRADLRSGGATVGAVYLLYNAASGFNCVVTLKSASVGAKTPASAYLEVQGRQRVTDAGPFAFYAGPVRAAAPGRCVRWGGSYGSVRRDMPFGHCGGTPDPPPPPAQPPQTPAPQGNQVTSLQPWAAGNRYLVIATLDGRSAPRRSAPARRNFVRAGQWVAIQCQTLGDAAYGSPVWDRIGGRYVPDRFVRTYATGLLPGAPRCTGTAPKPRPKPKAVPTRAACDQVRENEEIDFTFRQRFEHFAYDKSMVPARDIWRRPDQLYRMGKVRIGAATCRVGRTWRILSPVAIDYSSDGLDGNGEPRGDGWAKGLGIGVTGGRGPRRIRDPWVDVQAMSCARGVLWSLIEAAAGKGGPPLLDKVPGPYGRGLKLALKLGLHYLPKDKLTCRELSTYRLELGVSRSGRLLGGARALTYYPVKAESLVPGYRTVYEVQQFTPEVS